MSEKLKRVLEEKKVTQAELAENVGVSQAFVSYMIKGFKEPSVALLKRIAEYLNVKIDDLI